MWYNQDGIYQPFIMTLTDGKSKDLPMEWDDRYGLFGRRWFSGCHSIDLLRTWFSDLDIQELLSSGFKLYEFESSEYQIEEYQTIFTREGIQSKTQIQFA